MKKKIFDIILDNPALASFFIGDYALLLYVTEFPFLLSFLMVTFMVACSIAIGMAYTKTEIKNP